MLILYAYNISYSEISKTKAQCKKKARPCRMVSPNSMY